VALADEVVMAKLFFVGFNYARYLPQFADW
jgi:hypothetical protein